MNQNPLIAFLAEVFKRLASKSPKFFVIWQWLWGLVVAVTGLPTALQEFGIKLPAPLGILENKMAAIAAICSFIMAKFPIQQQVISKDGSGAPLTKVDPDKVPFTVNDQLKKNKL